MRVNKYCDYDFNLLNDELEINVLAEAVDVISKYQMLTFNDLPCFAKTK